MVVYHVLELDAEEDEACDFADWDVDDVGDGDDVDDEADALWSASVTLSMDARMDDTILRLSTPVRSCLKKKSYSTVAKSYNASSCKTVIQVNEHAV